MFSIGKIKKAAIYMFLGIFFGKLCSYGYRLLAARLGPEQYGTLSLGHALFGFAVIFSLLGLNEGVLRYYPFYLAKKRKRLAQGVFKTSILLSFMVSLVISALLFSKSAWFATFFNAPALDLVIRLFAVALPFTALWWILVYGLRSSEQISKAVLAQYYTEGITKVSFAFIFIVLGWGLGGVVGGYTLSMLSVFVVSFILLKKQTPLFEGRWIPKELLAYSVPLMFTGFLYFIMYYTDTLMIGYFLDTSSVGIYNVALPTAALLFMIPEAVLVLFIPLMTKHFAREEWKHLGGLFRKSFWYNLCCLIPLLIVLVVFAPIIIKLLFGEMYLGGSLALRILALGYFVRLVFMPYTRLLEVFRKQHLLLFITLAAAVVNIAFNYRLIPLLGIEGGAIATSLTYVGIGFTNFFMGAWYFRAFIKK